MVLCLYWCFRLPGIWHCFFTDISDCLGYGAVSLLMFQAAWDMTLCLYWCFRLPGIWHCLYWCFRLPGIWHCVFTDVSDCVGYDTVSLLMFQTVWDMTLCLYWCFKLPGVWHCVFTVVSDLLWYDKMSLLKVSDWDMALCLYWYFRVSVIWHVITKVSDSLEYGTMSLIKFQTVIWHQVFTDVSQKSAASIFKLYTETV
jgi:hypothetical protein